MNDETIKQLISNMDALSTRVTNLESEVSRLESEVESLSSRCRQFQQDIADLQ